MTTLTFLKRAAGLALLSAALPLATLRAQATAEGTVITNTASVSWTDANNNTYTPVTAAVSVTVGFTAGIDVTSAAQVTPASPSTGNSITFTINNIGNGRDTVQVSSTAAAGVTVTGYRYNATTYPSLAALNVALASVQINAGANITVDVLYDVASGQGGATIPVTLTATSVRTPATSDVSTTNVRPPASLGVTVTPDGATIDRLPSNGTTYTQAFTVTNTGNAADNFNLVASAVPGTVLTIVSVNGVPGASTSIPLAAGANASITVVYSVANVAAGTTDVLRLTATSQTNGAVNAQGDLTVRVIKPALTMTKEAYRDNQTTLLTATDRVVPGEFIQYKITVTNGGLASASSVSITDALPAQVTYQSAAGDLAGWTITAVGNNVTANLSGTLATGTSRFIWVRVRIN